MTPDEFLKLLNDRLQQPGMAGRINSLIRLDLAGSGGFPGCVWLLDARKAAAKVAVLTYGESGQEKPDCILSAKMDDFQALLAKKMTVPFAVIRGKLKISGSMAAATRLQLLMQ